ncbi:O-antigen ligase family protein [Rhizobium sp. CSW-27]|uniref:O-antigen ligase family protein n=1 Tax=Rhizobium sp. CSW-27 TaxID=2839985 RepID=UPI001C01991D|nr:O-antigen ligase family protein [Rhizobium sp. CSW-27]MBT9368982.1 O-antigen ligase family protein [Rhizobium sp. CSW-27]
MVAKSATFVSGSQRSGSSSEPEDETILRRVLRQVATGLLVLSVVVTMLTQGAVYPVSISLACILMAASMALAYLAMGLPRATRSLFVAVLACWLFAVLWSVVQTLDTPFGLAGHSAWRVLPEFGIKATASISPMPGAVPDAILSISLPAMAILTVLMLFRRDSVIERALRVFAVAGGLMAVFALFQYVAFPRSLMFGDKQYYLGNLTAPFVNRNTAATFYGVTLIALLSTYKGFRFQLIPGSPFLYRRSGWTPAQAMRWALLVFAAFGAVLATSSRGGVLATFIALFAMFTLATFFPATPHTEAGLAARTTEDGKTRVIRIIGILLALLIVAGVFAGRVVLRAEVQGSEDGRFCVLPGILAAIRDNLVLGAGPGAFINVFPAYRDAACGVTGVWDMAHNVYLDGMLGLGLPFIMVVLVLFATVMQLLRRGLLNRKSRRFVVVGGIASIILVAIHSAIDFSLQIPGFATWWAVYLGMIGSIGGGRLSSSEMKN